MALAANALTDYATVAAELGLSGSTDQALIERLIGVASQALEDYCQRKLAFAAGIIEKQAMQGGPKLLLDRTPMLVLGSATTDAGDLTSSDYRIDDPEIGTLWSDVGWSWSALIRGGRYSPNFTSDQEPQTEQKSATATYAGGYITGPQAYGAAGWPGAAATLNAGTLMKKTVGGTDQIWIATATTNGAALVTGGSEPSWPASPTANAFGKRGAFTAFYGGTSQVDGTVTWLYLGTAGAAGARGTAANLPPSLEEAAILVAKSMYRERRDNPNVKSESMLGVSYTYARTGSLPPQAMAMAMPYRRSA